jgi:hypothetical protein
MRVAARLLAVLAATACFALPDARAANPAWTFVIDERDQPLLSYLDDNGKTVFMVGCGRAFAIHAVYPGAPKKDGDKATITIDNKKTHMTFNGEIELDYGDGPPGSIPFVQWDLGFARQDPGLYGKKWYRLESRLFDFLDSGHPLTISAEGRTYVLPAVNVPRWRQRFQKIC